MANDELYTPKFIFDELQLNFDLDPCAPHQGALHVPHHNHYCICCNDGLTSQWQGRVWCNPPFSAPKLWVHKWQLWVHKWLNHNNGIILLPFGGNGKWLQDLWDSNARAVLLQPNTPFINTAGEVKKISYRIGLWALGDENIEAISRLGKIR